nr:MAG TPA: zipper dimerization domain transcription factor-like protein [Caudoviricetes sp.]
MYGNNFQQPFQPGMFGAAPQMQQRLAQMEQAYMPATQIPQYVICNMVSSVEEAKAREIIPNGASYFFPSPSENRIYEKSTGMDGQQVFKAYELVELPSVVPATTGSVKALEARIQNIENLLQELVGGTENAQSNAANGNGHAGAESNEPVTASGRAKPFNGKGPANGTR